MNTRVQVEHPVTEMITGLDLVRLQILVAEGEPLPFTQDEIAMKGHALEVRVYAEDPRNNFLPDIGRLKTYVRPQGPGIRVDDGFEQGMDIPIYYDPMIAKLVAYGANRTEAIERMTRAIEEYDITGVKTTLDFCRFAINHEAFVSGKFDTHFIGTYFTPEALDDESKEDEMVLAAFLGITSPEPGLSDSDPAHFHRAQTRWKRNRIM